MKQANQLISLVEKNAAKARTKTIEQRMQVEAGKTLPLQMTLFRDDLRAIPNYLARTPLFSTVPSKFKERPYLKDVVLASPSGFEIRYTGEQLDQSDCDIFMQIIHAASGKTISDERPLQINRGECLALTGRNDSGKSYQWLKEAVERLRDAKIVLESERYKFTGNLIREILEDKEGRDLVLTLSPAIVQMFSGSEYALVDWDKRKQIAKRVHLTKWLQNFTCSHEKGMQHHGIEKLAVWFGYTSPLRKFREALGDSLGELERLGVVSGATFYEEGKKVKWNRI